METTWTKIVRMMTQACSRFFPFVLQPLLVLALLVAPLRAQDQTSTNHFDTVESCQSQAEKVLEDFINALKRIQSNPSLLDAGEAEKVFYEFQKDCTSIKNDADQRLEIINKEIDRIKKTDLPGKDKNALTGTLSDNIQNLERLRGSLNKSIVYSTQSKPAEWKKIYANWVGVSGAEKAKERISEEIDAFSKGLPGIGKVGGYFSSRFQDFSYFLGNIINFLGNIIIFLTWFALIFWFVNLIWRAVLDLF